jgi:hypothetical protein
MIDLGENGKIAFLCTIVKKQAAFYHVLWLIFYQQIIIFTQYFRTNHDIQNTFLLPIVLVM